MDSRHLPAYIDYLMNMVSENKVEVFRRTVEDRSRFLTIVLEDLYQSHNSSAVLRSCDCFGLQDVHVIENKHKFAVIDDIGMGSNKWLTIHRYRNEENNTEAALRGLKSKGYRIIGTTPHANGMKLEDYPMDVPTALVFGTERKGLSQTALDLCDGYLQVPMHGFTESLNISVCAAICIHHLTHKMRTNGAKWQLSEGEKSLVLIQWALQVLGNEEILKKDFLSRLKR